MNLAENDHFWKGVSMEINETHKSATPALVEEINTDIWNFNSWVKQKSSLLYIPVLAECTTDICYTIPWNGS